MERTVLRYAPSYWDKDYGCNVQVNILGHTEEYKKLEYQIKQATKSTSLRINSIKRYQNIHDYGQVLIREQLMAVTNQYQNYSRVRRFVKIRRQYLANALEYNLDKRRCGGILRFNKYITCPNYEEIILVVQVITTNSNEDNIDPANSSDFFIDYIVDVSN